MPRIPPELSRQREIDAWDLVRQGYTQRQIAEQLKVSHQAVDKMLRRVEVRLLAALERRGKREKARQSEILDYIAAEALGAWRASKETFKSSTKKTRRVPQRQSASGAIIRTPEDDRASLEEILSRAESRHGNPAFLSQAREALADKRKIWGLDIAPAPQAPNANPLDKLAPEELEALEQKLAGQIADAKASRDSK
jgi:predicted transcriptional regulator